MAVLGGRTWCWYLHSQKDVWGRKVLQLNLDCWLFVKRLNIALVLIPGKLINSIKGGQFSPIFQKLNLCMVNKKGIQSGKSRQEEQAKCPQSGSDSVLAVTQPLTYSLHKQAPFLFSVYFYSRQTISQVSIYQGNCRVNKKKARWILTYKTPLKVRQRC